MRLRSLDIVRGFAALLVVVYHYQHFFAVGQNASSWFVDPATLPLYGVLKIVYLHGWMAVDLFFVISGFVFFWLYREAIYERKIDALAFAVLRLTRLYPLHLLTLLLVAGLQMLYARVAGSAFIIPHNDARHFWLNVFFLQSWGFEQGPSFNASSWSISVEIFLYMAFFVFALSRLSGSVLAAFGVMCLGLMVQSVNPVIGRGVAGFFAGGLAFHAVWAMGRHPRGPEVARRLIAFTAVLWLLVVVAVYADLMPHILSAVGWDAKAELAGKLSGRLVLYGLFPLTIIALTASEHVLGYQWSMNSFLGDISYAAYLLHFPLQVALAYGIVRGLIPQAAFTGTVGLLGFLAVLIPLSWLTYRYFELPMQRLGRRQLLGRRERFA